MSNLKEMVTVGVANEGEMNIKLDIVKDWEPKKVSHMGTSTFFEIDGSFFSMKRTDFSEIFGLKYK
jgi:hypothetical protein